MMSADRTCPMCWRPVAAGAPAILEHGDCIHAGCHLGLTDAGAAVARLLREQPGRGRCAACIAAALDLTLGEAQAASARLRSIRSFQERVETCPTCGARRHVVRARMGQAVSRSRRG